MQYNHLINHFINQCLLKFDLVEDENTQTSYGVYNERDKLIHSGEVKLTTEIPEVFLVKVIYTNKHYQLVIEYGFREFYMNAYLVVQSKPYSLTELFEVNGIQYDINQRMFLNSEQLINEELRVYQEIISEHLRLFKEIDKTTGKKLIENKENKEIEMHDLSLRTEINRALRKQQFEKVIFYIKQLKRPNQLDQERLQFCRVSRRSNRKSNRI